MKTTLILKCTPGAALLLLAGCASGPVGDPTDLDQPLLGESRATRFTMSSATGEFKVHDVIAVAKVLRRYKTLDAAEKALVELAVKQHIDALVALEIKKIAPKYEPERRRIASLPDPQARKLAFADVERRERQQALSNLANRYSGPYAVPMKASQNRNVVAFARVAEGGRVRVADSSFEVEGPPSSIGLGSKVLLAGDSEGVENLGLRGTQPAKVITAAQIR